MFNYFNFKESYVGFCENSEFLPKGFDIFNSEEKLRQLFLNLNNNITKRKFQFSKYEQKMLSKYPLKEAFIWKLKSLQPICNIKKFNNSNRVFNICIDSTIIINNFNNKKSVLINKLNPRLKLAKLISYCFINGDIQVLIDKQLLFHEFVLKKIKKMHKDKEVIDCGDSISIKQEDVCSLKVYTSWKNIEVTKPNINDEIKTAIKNIKKGEFNQVYLAFPKDDEFNKQIPIYVDELESKQYQIKVVPYSLRSILK